MTCYFPLKLWRTIKIMLDQDIVIPVAVVRNSKDHDLLFPLEAVTYN